MAKYKKRRWITATLHDLVQLLTKEKKRTFFLIIFTFSILMGAYTLTRECTYEAKAKFFTKNQSTPQASSILNLLGGDTPNFDKEAVIFLQSPGVLDPLIQKHHLQIQINKQAKNSLWSRIKDNFYIQWAHLRKKQEPLFPDLIQEIECQNIEFKGEFPRYFSIYFTSSKDFILTEAKTKQSYQGSLGVPLKNPSFSFTLKQQTTHSLKEKKYSLKMIPHLFLYGAIEEALTIEPSEESDSVLHLHFQHSNRIFSSIFLNDLMESYQNYLKEQTDLKRKKQVDYLTHRLQESNTQFQQILNEQAAIYQTEASITGFINTETESAFLATEQAKSKELLISLTLQKKKIHSLLASDTFLINDSIDPSIQKTLLNLKQEKKSLELAIYAKRKNKTVPTEKNLKMRVETLKKLRHEKESIQTLLTSLATASSENLPEYLADPTSLPYCDHYLKANLSAINLYEQILKNRLHSEDWDNMSFQGISLPSARTLSLEYNHQIDTLQGEFEQTNFILTQLNNPSFEISSLGNVLQDPVSLQSIQRASQYTFQLQDDFNRSEKEKERLHQQLQIERAFLKGHLNQSTNLIQIKIDLIESRTYRLLQVILDLVNEQTSILEQQFKHSLLNKLTILNQEEQILEQHLTNNQKQLTSLPKKMIAEKMIESNVALNRNLIEEITKLVESKNISHNLEYHLARPVEYAIPPLLPKSPSLHFFLVLGSFLGVFLGAATLLSKSFIQGFTASKQNLNAMNYFVSGSLECETLQQPLEYISQNDLDTLRNTQNFLLDHAHQSSNQGTVVSLVIGSEIDYSHYFAALMAHREFKTLTIKFSHTEESSSLETLVKDEHIFSSTPKSCELQIDYNQRFLPEILSSSNYLKLMQQARDHFDWIFIVYPLSLHPPLIEGLLRKSDLACLTLCQDRLETIEQMEEQIKNFTPQTVCFLLRDC